MPRNGRQIDSRLRRIEERRPRPGKPSSTKCEPVVRWLAQILDAFPPDLARSGIVVWKRPSEAAGLIPHVPFRHHNTDVNYPPKDDSHRAYRVPIGDERLSAIRVACRQIVADVRAHVITDLSSFLAALPAECREGIYFALGRLVGRW